MVLVQDLAAHPKTEAGTAVALGGEERLKEALLGRVGYPMPGIGNGDANARPARTPVDLGARSQDKGAGLAGGVKSVADEVREYLAQLRAEAPDPIRVTILAAQDDAGMAKARFINGQCGIQQIGNLLFSGDVPLAVEAKGVRDDMGDACQTPSARFGNTFLPLRWWPPARSGKADWSPTRGDY